MKSYLHVLRRRCEESAQREEVVERFDEQEDREDDILDIAEQLEIRSDQVSPLQDKDVVRSDHRDKSDPEAERRAFFLDEMHDQPFEVFERFQAHDCGSSTSWQR